jgi:predicted small integral membrane protein
MLLVRLVKIVICLALGLFGVLVAYDNIVDYDANYAFVGHVLSMDTTFPHSPLRSRAIADPALWHAAYAAIIAAEGLTGLLFLGGSLQMWRARRAKSHRFQKAKSLAIAGGALGFLIWYFGFTMIAGEWFAMWQSAQWNGQQAAFRVYVTILLALIFVAMRDEDLIERP